MFASIDVNFFVWQMCAPKTFFRMHSSNVSAEQWKTNAGALSSTASSPQRTGEEMKVSSFGISSPVQQSNCHLSAKVNRARPAALGRARNLRAVEGEGEPRNLDVLF